MFVNLLWQCYNTRPALYDVWPPLDKRRNCGEGTNSHTQDEAHREEDGARECDSISKGHCLKARHRTLHGFHRFGDECVTARDLFRLTFEVMCSFGHKGRNTW